MSDLTGFDSCSIFAVDDDCGRAGTAVVWTLFAHPDRPDEGLRHMQQVICVNIAALAIASLYYLWRDRFAKHIQRQRVLRERVAYMLWCAANQVA